MNEKSLYLGVVVKYLKDKNRIDASIYGGEKNNKFTMAGLSKALSLAPVDVRNLLSGKTTANYGAVVSLFAPAIRKFLWTLPEPIKEMGVTVIGENKVSNHADINDVLKQCLIKDPEDIERFIENYSGVYQVWRFAAHVAGAAAPRLVDGGDKPTYEPLVVKAALKIERGEILPIFSIRYLPHAVSGKGKERLINGVVARVGIPGHIYFFGHEEDSGYPLFMVGKHELVEPEEINCFVVRKHEGNPIFMSRVVLDKLEKDAIFENLDIGMYPKSEVIDQITKFGSKLENKPHRQEVVGFECGIVLE